MKTPKAITIIFPHQLFKKNPALSVQRPVYLVEELLFFRQYLFHKNKILFHRASMKAYHSHLLQKGFHVEYIDSTNSLSDIRKLIPAFAKEGVDEIHYNDCVDNWLEKRIAESAIKFNFKCKIYTTPGFINNPEEANHFFDKKKKYFQTDFYIHERKKRNLLIENNNPVGGKWTYDSDNRKRLPTNEKIPAISIPDRNNFISEAEQYVNKFYQENYGTIDNFFYPVTFEDAGKWLDEFLKTRFYNFGVYEDAMEKEHDILFHSVLSPLLNTGLLDLNHVIQQSLKTAEEYDIPINSVEGFVRQIIGWREFIRIVYEREGTYQRTRNFWGFKRKIPNSFWTGETKIQPVDSVIRRVLKTGYSHHIERLMVMGNFMLLCEFDPDEVYRWFMEMYIDSYDWVMVPNVYGMTQFADGGLMTTKPYISGSNYLIKMGNWDKGEWQKIWDGLFWRFMHVHRDVLFKNPRLRMLIGTFDKMPAEKRNKHLQVAETYLETLG